MKGRTCGTCRYYKEYDQWYDMESPPYCVMLDEEVDILGICGEYDEGEFK